MLSEYFVTETKREQIMWVIKWILGALLIVIVLGFALQNQYQMVQVRILNWISPELPLYLIVYISFAFGLFTWLIASIFKIMQLKVETRQWKKKVDELQDELNRLRNLSVEEAVVSSAKEQSSLPEKKE